MRVLALDHGTARCGVAVCDPTGTVVTPLDAVERPDTRKGMARIRAAIEAAGAELVVVGLPLSLHGGDSAQTRQARQFAQRLAAQVGVPVETYDERFTTRIAVSRGGTASEDSRAAAVVLEDWLTARTKGARPN